MRSFAIRWIVVLDKPIELAERGKAKLVVQRVDASESSKDIQ